MIEEFIRKFTDDKIEFVQIDRKFFCANDQIKEIKSKIPIKCEAIGTFLGEIDKKHFKPSLSLIQWLGSRTQNIAIVDEKSAWLFTCGRDVFSESIKVCSIEKGPVIVQNEQKEVLGYGFKDSKGIKNRHHLGEYLSL